MWPVFIFFLCFCFHQVMGEPEASEIQSWPLFEFWNPLTWLSPRFTSETMYYFLRGGRGSNRKIYQQLKKALLPSNLFFGNILAENAASERESKRKYGKSGGSRRTPARKGTKSKKP